MINKRMIFTEEQAQNIYFVSDTHFNHKNIIKYCKRPFKNIEENDTELIRRWNEKVPKDGIVFHLGDVAFGDPDKVDKILEQLYAIPVVLSGNDD